MKQLLLVLGLSLVLVGCYHEGTSSGAPQPGVTDQEEGLTDEEELIEGEGMVVEISNFAFSPAALTVEPGETITVVNLDAVGHTMTSDDGQAFDSGLVEQDESVSFTAPTDPGEYPFHCTPHPNIKGTLTVEG